MSSHKIIVAIGGNALIKEGQRGTITEQFANTRSCLKGVVKLISEGHSVVITHGNGPQVGTLLLKMEAALDKAPDMPLGVCVAASQGQIGYMIQQSLYNMLHSSGLNKSVVTIVTQVIVDKDDKAFLEPSKPIGSFYNKVEAEELKAHGWAVKKDVNRGYRRVVPSPKPIEIFEGSLIKHLIEQGHIVIASGGGGIPVVIEPDGTLEGVDAVVDKDLAACKLALAVGADLLIMLTSVPKIALEYGSPLQQDLDSMTSGEAKKYLDEDQFAAGSMAPKIKAALEFIEASKGKVYIAALDQVYEAVQGKAGTCISN